MAHHHEARTFEDLVRARMQRDGLALKELARRMGATPQAVSRILGANNPCVATINRVARALGVDPRELVP